jgi:hypothetical protein
MDLVDAEREFKYCIAQTENYGQQRGMEIGIVLLLVSTRL